MPQESRVRWGVGAIVRCNSKEAQTKYPLTLGEDYEVIEYNNRGTFEGVTIVNDEGRKAKYKTKYFQIIKNADISHIIKNLEWS